MLDTLRRRLERLEGDAARPWVCILIGPHGATATYHGDPRGGSHTMAVEEAQTLAERLRAEGTKVLVLERRIVDPMPRPVGMVH